MASPIVLSFDHAQNRIGRDRLMVMAEGSYKANRGGRQSGWSLIESTGSWQDPITFTAMLRPTWMEDAWKTTSTGAYARYAVADLTFSDSADWEDVDVPGEIGWIRKSECDNDDVFTPTLGNINQPMLVSMFGFGAADANRIIMECGWSDDGSRQVALRVYGTGIVEVWKGENLVATGKISGGQSSDSTQEKWLRLMLMPFRRRELLVFSESGDGFSHVFVDLPEDGEVQTIVPNTKFWVTIPSGTATIQIAKVQFAESGNLYSYERLFADPPPTGIGAPSYEAIYDVSGYGATTAATTILESDLSGAFTPNGIKDAARVKIAMTGGPSASPFVYAGIAVYDGETVQTDDTEETDAVWKGFSLTVPDAPKGTRASVTILDPLATGIDRLTSGAGNRPVHVHCGGISMIDGRTAPPKVTLGRIPSLDVMTCDIYDAWQALENYRYQERYPLDGLDFVDAVKMQFLVAGFDASQLIVEDPGIIIGLASSPTAGEWTSLIKEGDTAAQWVERLFEAYAGDWFYGIVPQDDGMPAFVASSPASLSETPDVELFTLREDAVDQLLLEGMSADEAYLYAWQRTIQSIDITLAFPEATDVRITGIDYRQYKYLQSKYIDANAQDPTLAPSARPDNWLGERFRYGLLEPMLTTQDMTDDAAIKLGDRLTRVRVMADIATDLVFKTDGVPLWRGGVIRVDGDEKWRVRSIAAKVTKDVDPTSDNLVGLACRRPATYAVEKLVGDAPPWGVSTGQVGSKKISQNQLKRIAQQGLIHRPLFDGLVRGK